MILVVTSSSQAFAQIEHSLMNRLRLTLTDGNFVRVHSMEDALALMSREEDYFRVVFVAAATFAIAVEWESSLRQVYVDIPLVVLHRADRIKPLVRPHTEDLSFPLLSLVMANALYRLIPDFMVSVDRQLVTVQ